MVGNEEQERVFGYLEDRFGISRGALDAFSLWARSGTYFALRASSGCPGDLVKLRVVTVGLPLLRRIGTQHIKPTSSALRLLSPRITRNRIRLDKAEALTLLAHGEIPWPEPVSEGYVLLETVSGVLGCGLMLPGRLRSQIPRSEVRTLHLVS